MERFGLDALVRIACDEYEKLHTLDFTYFTYVRNGAIMNRMTADAAGIRNFVVAPFIFAVARANGRWRPCASRCA